MRLASLAAACLAACSFTPGGAPVTEPSDDAPIVDAPDLDAPIVDAPIDAPIDVAIDAFVCTCPLGCRADTSCVDFTPANPGDFPPAATPLGSIVLGDGLYIFDSSNLTVLGPVGAEPLTGVIQDSHDGLWVLAAEQITIGAGATLRGTGPRAIKLLSRGDIVVAGIVDVSAGCLASDVGNWCGGPGGGNGGRPNPSGTDVLAATGCGPGGPGAAGATTRESGAGGGGFGTGGGNGGVGNFGDGFWVGGGGGGGVCGSPLLTPLTGGSGGGGAGYPSGSGPTDDGRTSGGGGGGAIQLSAVRAITIDGVIRAAGTGGRATSFGDDGGGGGGAGGGILLEAPVITVGASGRIVAHGGGGGAGFIAALAGAGENGRDDRTRAAGGLNGTDPGGGAGAIGALAGEIAVAGTPAADGGSGGGGGAGRIRLVTTPGGATLGGLVSPTPGTGVIVPR